MSETIHLSLVIPLHNEQERIPELKKGLQNFIESCGHLNYEFILVENGSADQTLEKLRRLRDELLNPLNDHLRGIQILQSPKGKGAALKTGALASRGAWILTLDADMATPAVHILEWEKQGYIRLTETQDANARFYFGSREYPSRPEDISDSAFRRILGRGFNLMIQLITGLYMPDTQCGFKLYPRWLAVSCFQRLRHFGWAHDVELLKIIERTGVEMIALPVRWRAVEKSKIQPFYDSWRMLREVISIQTAFFLFQMLGLEKNQTEKEKTIIRYDRLSMLWLALIAGIIVLTFRDYGMTWDEGMQNDYGQLTLAYYIGWLTGSADHRALQFLDLYLYGGFFDGLCALVNLFSPLDEYDTRHLINALFGWLGLVGCWRLARHVAGPVAAFASVALLTLTPSYFGDMFANPKDIPFAVGYIWSVYYLMLCGSFLPRVPVGLALKTGFAIGLTLGVRVGGLMLFGYLGLLTVVFLIAESVRTRRLPWSSARMIIPSLAIIVFISYALMIALWPWAQSNPLVHPFIALQEFSRHQGGPPAMLFNGRLIDTWNLPIDYIPIMLGIKLPEIIIVLLCIGSVMAFFQVWREGWRTLLKPDALFLLFTILFPVCFIILTNARLYDGLRHVLFIIPPLTILAGISVARLASWMKNRNRILTKGVYAVVIVYFVYHTGVMVYLHPYEYIYYNRFIGGIRGVEGRFDTDYWGAAHREAVVKLSTYLQSRHDESSYRIAVCFNPFLAAHYLTPNLSMTDELEQTDFLLATTRGNCHLWVKAPELFRIERFGAPLMVVKDLRSNSP